MTFVTWRDLKKIVLDSMGVRPRHPAMPGSGGFSVQGGQDFMASATEPDCGTRPEGPLGEVSATVNGSMPQTARPAGAW